MSGIVVVARQRSGTNFLRSLLATSTDLPNLGEVFDHKAGRRDINYFPFQAERAAQYAAPRGRADCVAELQAYFDHLDSLFPRHIIDVKYNQTLVCAPTFASPADLPPLLEVLAARGYGIVHLVRETVCATIVSDQVAKATGTWHVPQEAQSGVPLVKVRIDPPTFIGECQRREREIAVFRDFCARAGRSMEVRYEDIAETPPEQAAPVIEAVCRLAGVERRRVGRPYFKKGLGFWLDYVENAADLVAAMRAAPAVRHYVEHVGTAALASAGGVAMLSDPQPGTQAP